MIDSNHPIVVRYSPPPENATQCLLSFFPFLLHLQSMPVEPSTARAKPPGLAVAPERARGNPRRMASLRGGPAGPFRHKFPFHQFPLLGCFVALLRCTSVNRSCIQTGRPKKSLVRHTHTKKKKTFESVHTKGCIRERNIHMEETEGALDRENVRRGRGGVYISPPRFLLSAIIAYR